MVGGSDLRTGVGYGEHARLITRVGAEIARRSEDENDQAPHRRAGLARRRETLVASYERAALRAERDALTRLAGRSRQA